MNKEVAEIFDFEFNEEIPENCLEKDCWMEKLIIAVEKELTKETFC